MFKQVDVKQGDTLGFESNESSPDVKALGNVAQNQSQTRGF